MAEPRTIRLTTGDGPLGTGIYVLRLRPVDESQLEGESWAMAAFLPLFPLGRVRLTKKDVHRYEEQPAGRPAPRELAATYARGLAGLAFVLASLTMAYLCVAESSWFAGLGVLVGGGLPLALVGWLDQTLRRRRGAAA